MRIVLLVIVYFFFLSPMFSEIRANYKNNNVEIYWSQPDDQFSEYFIIERSKNGRYFKPIMKVICGSKKTEYYEIDYHAPSKLAYYRIRQRTDNGYKYSKTLMVKNHTKGNNHYKKSLKKFKENNVLAVLRSKLGLEYFCKVDIFVKKREIIGLTLDNIEEGNYTIISTSEDILLNRKITIRKKK